MEYVLTEIRDFLAIMSNFTTLQFLLTSPRSSLPPLTIFQINQISNDNRQQAVQSMYRFHLQQEHDFNEVVHAVLFFQVSTENQNLPQSTRLSNIQRLFSMMRQSELEKLLKLVLLNVF